MLFKNFLTVSMFFTKFVMFQCGIVDTFDNHHLNSFHGDSFHEDNHIDSFNEGEHHNHLDSFNEGEHHHEEHKEEEHHNEEHQEEEQQHEEKHEDQPQHIHTVHHYHIQKYTVIKKVEVPVFKEVRVPYKVYVFHKVPYKFYVKPYIVHVPIEYYHTKEEKHEKPTHEMVKHDDDEHEAEHETGDHNEHHTSAEEKSFHAK